MILDGELVAFDADGKPSFGALQDRAQLKTEREIAAADQSTPVVFYCFDLLYFAGIDLRKSPYRDRRRYLAQCLLPSPLVQLVHAAEDGVALQAAALASGFEGVVGKRKDSRYEAGRRSTSWLKVKPTQSADFVVGGYTQGKGSRAPLGRAPRRLLGGQDAGKLRYASHVGSGFDDRTLAQVKARLEPLQRKHLPVRREARAQCADDLGRAEVVAEVSFQSWTDDDHLRAPVFLRLRDDIDPKTVRRAKPARRLPQPRPTRADRRPDRRDRRAARNREGGVHARGGTAPDPPHASRPRLLAGGSGAASSRRSPSATCCATSRRCRRTCCRTSPTGRSR